MPDSLMDNDSKGMTSLHRAAQQALAQNLKIMLPNHPLGFGGGRYKFSKVALEAPVGNRRVDCLGIGEGMVGTLYEKIRVAIEIRVTNPVDGDKLADLQEHDLNAVVEIDLSSLSKTEWDADTLEFDVCDSTKNIKWLYSDKDKAYANIYEEREVEASTEWERHLVDIVERYKIGKFSKKYSVTAMNCWKCKEATPIFTWPEHESLAWDETEPVPPNPKPRTVKFTWSNTIQGRYWGNRCGKCGVLQGDFYINLESKLYHEAWLDQWHMDHYGDGNDTVAQSVLSNWILSQRLSKRKR